MFDRANTKQVSAVLIFFKKCIIPIIIIKRIQRRRSWQNRDDFKFFKFF